MNPLTSRFGDLRAFHCRTLALEEEECGGHDEEGEDGRGDDPAEHDHAQPLAELRSLSPAEHQGAGDDQDGERCHDDRSEPEPC